MYLFLIIGHTGQGKTTLVKKMIEGKRSYVFDINNEYPNHVPDRIRTPKIRHINGDADQFTEKIKNLKLTGYNIVFEDSTGYLRGRQSAPFIRQIVNKRHTKNNYFLLFHSLNRIPPELMELCNFIYLFKTIDNKERVEQKFHDERLLLAMDKVKAAPKFCYAKIKMI